MTMSKVEWSGVLFYQVKGSIKNIDKVKIVLKDVLLMDRGIKVHTKFDWDEDVVEYRMSNPESMEWLVGLIHSHNTMNVGFSGEDWDELNDNCSNHNFYLSLIVNNYMEMTAKIVFTGEQKELVCKDEKGYDYTIVIDQDKDNPALDPIMLVYNCEVQIKQERVKVSDEFAARVEIIDKKSAKRDKEEEEERKKKVQGYSNTHPKIEKGSKKGDGVAKAVFPDWERGVNQGWGDDWGKSDHPWIDAFEEVKKKSDVKEEDEFLAFMFRIGNKVKEDNAEDALEEVNMADVNLDILFNLIADSYDEFYTVFFGSGHDPMHYSNILEGCIRILKSIRKKFPNIDRLTDKLVRKQTDISISKQDTQIVKQGDN